MLKKYGFQIKAENYIQDEWRTTKKLHEYFTIGLKEYTLETYKIVSKSELRELYFSILDEVDASYKKLGVALDSERVKDFKNISGLTSPAGFIHYKTVIDLPKDEILIKIY